MLDIKSLTPQRMNGNWQVGIVVDNNDPLKQMRVRIRARDIHRQIPDANLPWAVRCFDSPQGQTSGGVGSISVPVPGSKVWFQFMDDSLFYPVYYGYYNTSDTNNTELQEGYPNAYGYIDKFGNKWFVDANNNVEFAHQSGSFIEVSANGTVTVAQQSGSNILLDNASNTMNIDHQSGSYIKFTSDGNINVVAANQLNLTGTILMTNVRDNGEYRTHMGLLSRTWSDINPVQRPSVVTQGDQFPSAGVTPLSPLAPRVVPSATPFNNMINY